MKLNYIFCQVTSKDDLDGYVNGLVYANDLKPIEYLTIGSSMTQDEEFVREVSRDVIDAIQKSIENGDNYYGFNDNEATLLDLSEPFFTNNGGAQ